MLYRALLQKEMTKVLTVNSDEMKKIEERTFNDFCVPSVVLMENAAHGFFDALKSETGCVSGKKIAVFCGKGNNGGDGYAIARYLFNAGAYITVFRLCDEEKIKGDAKTNYEIIKKMNITIKENPCDLKDCDIIIDAIFGIGFYGKAEGKEKEAIELINESKAFTASVDVPSGICVSDGKVDGEAVFADLVVTFGFYKTGLFLYPAKEYAKKVVCCDISIPKNIADSGGKTFLLDKDILKLLPERKANSHKGSFGRVLCLAGSEKYTGAAYLCATAAQKSGAGLVTCAVPECAYEILASKFTEVMTLALAKDITLAQETIKDFAKDVLLVGCGMGRSEYAKNIILNTIESTDVPCVIDADGLNALIGHLDLLKKRKNATILTPHIKEFARLLDVSTEEVLDNRLSLVCSFAKEYGVVLVLKSADTVIALPDGKVFICAYSNSGLAKGGSGDVLAGICVSLLAQSVTAEAAACAAVYLHSRAGFFAKENLGEYFMTATDIIKYLPMAFGEKDN